MDKYLKRLETAWEENPVQVMFAAALLLTASAKFIDASGAARSRRAYSKAVAYRVKHGLK